MYVITKIILYYIWAAHAENAETMINIRSTGLVHAEHYQWILKYVYWFIASQEHNQNKVHYYVI